MRHYDEFEPSGYSFEARVGAPDPISAAIGRIALNFGVFEASLGATLYRLLEADGGWGGLLTHPLSFDATLDFLEDRVRLLAPTGAFNTGDADPLEVFAELRALCAQAAQLRAQVFDPTRAQVLLTRALQWRRRRARGRDQQAPSAGGRDQGARQPHGDSSRPDLMGDPGALLDVADFIAAVTDDVEEFFMPG
jgi:hypothetical protein